MTEMDRDPNRVLSMILDMQKIYTKYLDQATKVKDQHDQIRTHVLGLEQDFHISDKEREQAVTLLQEQAKKLKQYKKMIDTL